VTRPDGTAAAGPPVHEPPSTKEGWTAYIQQQPSRVDLLSAQQLEAEHPRIKTPPPVTRSRRSAAPIDSGPPPGSSFVAARDSPSSAPDNGDIGCMCCCGWY